MRGRWCRASPVLSGAGASRTACGLPHLFCLLGLGSLCAALVGGGGANRLSLPASLQQQQLAALQRSCLPSSSALHPAHPAPPHPALPWPPLPLAALPVLLPAGQGGRAGARLWRAHPAAHHGEATGQHAGPAPLGVVGGSSWWAQPSKSWAVHFSNWHTPPRQYAFIRQALQHPAAPSLPQHAMHAVAGA